MEDLKSKPLFRGGPTLTPRSGIDVMKISSGPRIILPEGFDDQALFELPFKGKTIQISGLLVPPGTLRAAWNAL